MPIARHDDGRSSSESSKLRICGSRFRMTWASHLLSSVLQASFCASSGARSNAGRMGSSLSEEPCNKKKAAPWTPINSMMPELMTWTISSTLVEAAVASASSYTVLSSRTFWTRRVLVRESSWAVEATCASRRLCDCSRSDTFRPL